MKKLQYKVVSTLLIVAVAVLMLAPVSAARVYAASVNQTDATLTSITVSWGAATNAVNYRVFYMEGYSGTYIQSGGNLPATARSANITGLKAGTVYNVKVLYDYTLSSGSLIKDGLVGYGSSFKTLPDKVTGVNQLRWYYNIKVLDIGWDKQAGADRYEYVVTDSKSRIKSQGVTYSNYVSVSNISNTMVYSVKVRAISTIMGSEKAGDWSEVGYCFTQPYLSEKGYYAKVSNGKLQIKFPKVNGATGYDVMVSTKPTSGYKKVKSLGASKNTVSLAKVAGKAVNSKKTYYVYVVAKKKVGTITYTSGILYYWNTKNNLYPGYF